jgi:predicted unusual protein kinase regulating ubiquinone biosynthesis (AarF/ABC1/UbiB family)
MKELKKIKSGFLSRQIGIAKLAVKTGSSLYKNRNKDLKSQLKNSIEDYAADIVEELGVMKGSFMKAGQMLSLFGGSFLPEEAHKVLKSLENKTSFLIWDRIKKQIPNQWIEELDITQVPFAAASLGQVHLVQLNNDKYAMKIQYKGVAKAIKNDIKALKLFLKTLNLIPKEIDLTEIYKEIELMLNKEVDYIEEVRNTEKFATILKDFSIYKIPKINHNYSNEKIITLEYLDGHSLNEIESLSLTQEQCNTLGREFMRLLFLEIFVFEEIQTDAHFGNYILITEPELKWGLIDFGATKSAPKDFIVSYRKLLIHLSKRDKENFISMLFEMGYLSKKKDSDLDLFWEYANVVGAPFYEEEFDWGKADIADQMFGYIPKIIKSISIGNPPSHSVFIDKKIAGVYFILQKLKAKFNVTEVLDEVISYQKSLEP